MTQTPKTKLIRITLKQSETLFMTQSPDMRGLIVTARTEAEVLKKTPGAIKEMLDFVGGNWIVMEVENPQAIGAEHAFAAIPASAIGDRDEQ